MLTGNSAISTLLTKFLVRIHYIPLRHLPPSED
jgi:hypothetical protein